MQTGASTNPIQSGEERGDDRTAQIGGEIGMYAQR